MAPLPYRYLLAIRRQPRWQGENWRDLFINDLAKNCSHRIFGPGGKLYNSAQPMGMYEFLSVETVDERCGGDGWHPPPTPPQFLGPVLGYINWEWWLNYLDFNDRQFYAQLFLFTGGGSITRCDNGLFFDVWKKQSFPLRELEQKHGFQDGDALAEWPGYLSYAEGVASEALQAHRLSAHWPRHGSSHNRLRVDIKANTKEPYEKVYARFQAIEDQNISLWSYDAIGTEAPSFRALLDDSFET